MNVKLQISFSLALITDIRTYTIFMKKQWNLREENLKDTKKYFNIKMYSNIYSNSRSNVEMI